MKNNLLSLAFLLFGTAGFLSAQTFEVYVSDAGNFTTGFQILKFDGNGENGEVFINEQLAWPQDIVFLDHRNSVIISNLSSKRITEYDAETGEYLGEFAAVEGEPTRMKVGEDGLLYVLQWAVGGTVLRFNLDGNPVDTFTTAGVSRSIGMDWDADGNLYVSSWTGNFVQKFSPTGEDMGRFISSNLNGPTNIWFDEEGNLLVANWTGGEVRKFNSEGNYEGVFIGNIGSVEGVSILPNGDILLGDGADGSINRYDSEGDFIEELVPKGSLGLSTPNAVILREVVTSVKKAPEPVNFIAPTIGTEFHILGDKVAASDIEAFEAYDMQGRLQARIPYTGQHIFWNASAHPAGMYTIVARLKDSTAWRQKVVVAQR